MPPDTIAYVSNEKELSHEAAERVREEIRREWVKQGYNSAATGRVFRKANGKPMTGQAITQLLPKGNEPPKNNPGYRTAENVARARGVHVSFYLEGVVAVDVAPCRQAIIEAAKMVGGYSEADYRKLRALRFETDLGLVFWAQQLDAIRAKRQATDEPNDHAPPTKRRKTG
jgi:hypothetical protein